ncbi:MAG: hypothetical protein ACRCWG_05200 [Sarcina sp.]
MAGIAFTFLIVKIKRIILFCPKAYLIAFTFLIVKIKLSQQTHDIFPYFDLHSS